MIQIPDEAYAAMYVIKTHYIMRVIKFYPDSQTVDLIQDVYEYTNVPLGNMSIINEYGQQVVVGLREPTVLHNIPVKQLRWGQFEIQCCPVEGDTGYIEIMTNDIRDWMQNGSSSIPWSDSHFAKESCVFVPFVPNLTNAVEDYPEDNSTLVIKSKNAHLKFTDRDGDEPVVDIETTANTIHINAEDGITVEGDLEITGDITVTGDVNVTGAISATGEISSQTDVVVKTPAGNVSLLSHTHTSAAPGSPTSTPTLVPDVPSQP